MKIKLVLVVLVILCLIDAVFIEPNIIQIKNYKIFDENLKNLKIVFISDLHLRKNQEEKLDKIVRKINLQNPDVVLSAGDFLSDSDTESLTPDNIASGLAKIHAKYGFYTVLGNHDCRKDESYLVNYFEKKGLKVLQNSNCFIPAKNLYIAGIEDDTMRNPDLAKALENTDTPRILLMHSPDWYEKVNDDVSLILAGHNHGGQIQIPLLGPLFLPAKTGRKYACGFYSDESKKMIVTKGIGTSILDMRFNCLPEIVVIDFE